MECLYQPPQMSLQPVPILFGYPNSGIVVVILQCGCMHVLNHQVNAIQLLALLVIPAPCRISFPDIHSTTMAILAF
jgi:hypothetical protein